MPREIALSEARCTKLAFEAPVDVGSDQKSDKLSDFVIQAYTGEPVFRWWGLLVIDIEGILSKAQMPIFRNHDSMAIVGFSTNTWKAESFYVEGKFSQATEWAKEVQALALEGFPWQASIGVNPIKILSLEKGAEHQVNGRLVTGPAEIWLESEVYETSFVPLGADANTSVAMLARIEEKPAPPVEPQKQEEQPMLTMEQLKADHPELFEGVMALGRKEGSTAELARIKAVQEQSLPGHEALIRSMIDDGQTTGEQAAVKILAAERLARITAAQNLSDDAGAVPPVPVSTPPAVDPQALKHDLSTEDGRKKAWEADAKLREEFRGDFKTFEAYESHKHQAKVRG